MARGAGSARQAATSLIAEHGDQARHILREQIQECEARDEPTKELWAVMQEVRRTSRDDGIDTATRMIDEV
jgi:hypothetical protein